MAHVQTAIHLRTGEPELAEAVDAWLRRHDVQTVVLADVYEACVYLLQHRADVPDLAFVGADWLGADDIVILSYLRETWPAAAIVVYSSGHRSVVSEPGARQHVCPTPDALRRLLDDPPERLLQEWHASLAANGQHAKPVSSSGGPGRLDPQCGPTRTSVPPDIDNCPGIRSGVPEVDPPRSVPTDDELSALPDEDEG